MNLSKLAGLGSALAAVAALAAGNSGLRLPWLLEAALWHTAGAGAAVAAFSSDSLADRCLLATGKDPMTGHIGWAAYLALAPYHVGVMTAYWLYRATQALGRHGEPPCSRLAAWLYLGGWPATAVQLPLHGMAVLDVTNELPAQVQSTTYHCCACWETHGPAPQAMQDAVEWALAQRRAGRPIFCHCTHVRRVAAGDPQTCWAGCSWLCRCAMQCRPTIPPHVLGLTPHAGPRPQRCHGGGTAAGGR